MAPKLRIKLCSPKENTNLPSSTSTLGREQISKPTLSAAAQCMRRKRQLLKQDKDAWDSFRASEAERHRYRRQNRSPAQIANDRETGVIRSRKYYSMKKAEGKLSSQKKVVKVLTRAEKKGQRDYWREHQAACRQNKSVQKQTWDRMKDKERKIIARTQNNKTRLNANPSQPETTSNSPRLEPGYSTSGAKCKAVSRIWSRLPKDANKFAEIVTEFLSNHRLTPRKKTALQARGLLHPKCKKRLQFTRDRAWKKLQQNIAELKQKVNDKSKQRRQILVASLLVEKKYRHQRQLANDLGLRPNYFTKLTQHDHADGRFRNTRSDVTCLDVVTSITNMYRSQEVSREMPTLRTVKKDLVPRRVMEVTVTRAFQIWKSRYPENTSVSLSTFQKLRPDDVLLLRRNILNQCLCDICTDVMLKLQILNQTATICKQGECKLTDKYSLIAATLCPKQTGKQCFQLNCVDRSCSECGVKLLEGRFNELLQANGDRQVGWKKWTTKSYNHDGEKKSKKSLILKTGTLKMMVDELMDETQVLSKHIFVAKWQHDMFSKICSDLPKESMVFVLDFAENYACIQQDEIQSAHWATEQVTIHPIVAYYHCPEHTHSDDSHIVQEAVVIISSDKKHDAHAVHHFTRIALDHLRQERGVSIQNLIEFTDGCGVQYKSKMPFADISYATKDLNVSFVRHYFGSRHGKGPSDGVSGVIKAAARRAVLTRKFVINTAESMFKFCQENLIRNDCRKQRRDFFFVKDDEINRDRPDRLVKGSLVGTRGLHSVKCLQPGVVGVILLSCFCGGCLGDDKCENAVYSPPWQRRALAMVNPPSVENTPITENRVSTDNVLDQRGITEIWQSLENGGIVNGTVLAGICDQRSDDVDMEWEAEHLNNILNSEEVSTNEAAMPGSVPIDLPQSVISLDIVPDAFYAVYFTNKFYIGKAMSDCIEGHVQMSFLEQKVQNTFWWPNRRDELKVAQNFIFHGPINMNGHHSMSLPDEDIVFISNKHQQLRKAWH